MVQISAQSVKSHNIYLFAHFEPVYNTNEKCLGPATFGYALICLHHTPKNIAGCHFLKSCKNLWKGYPLKKNSGVPKLTRVYRSKFQVNRYNHLACRVRTEGSKSETLKATDAADNIMIKRLASQSLRTCIFLVLTVSRSLEENIWDNPRRPRCQYSSNDISLCNCCYCSKCKPTCPFSEKVHLSTKSQSK